MADLGDACTGLAARKGRLALLLATAVGATLASPVGVLADQRNVTTRSFVLSNIFSPQVNDPKACPRLSDKPISIFLRSLPAGERAHYAGSDKEPELFRLMAQRLGFKVGTSGATAPGNVNIVTVTPEQVVAAREKAGIPPGKGAINFLGRRIAYDSCTDPDDFQLFNQGHQDYAGKVAFGIDLDGRTKPGDFTSPDGRSGIDNEYWRAVGCSMGFAGSGDPETNRAMFFSRSAPTLVEVTGIDDARNDDSVEVTVSPSTTPLVIDAKGRAMAWSSYDVDPDPTMVGKARGRIRDGVLTTDPFTLKVRAVEQIVNGSRTFLDARLKASFKDDVIEGEIFGYQLVSGIVGQLAQSAQVGSNLTGFSCPAVIASLNRHADGFPDPKTGRNTAISSAFMFYGAAAFPIRPAATAQLAEDQGSAAKGATR